MKKTKWKPLALVVALAMAVTACGKPEVEDTSASTEENSEAVVESTVTDEEKSYFNETGFPIVNEEITLKVVCCEASLRTVDFEEMEGWKYLSELTGINFEFESYNSEEIYTKMPLIMSDPDNMPDLFIQCGMMPDELLSYGQQGLLMDLTDLIEKYGENTKACWTAEPLNRSYATSTDGKIYGLPAYNDTGVPTNVLMQVNSRWLENCGITELPTNVDELKEMLIKFRDMDANGNGDPTDEIPMLGDQSLLLYMLAVAYNFPLDWPYTGVIYGAQYGTTEAKPVFMLDNYRAMVEYVRELYDEGLINQDMFSVSSEETNARRKEDRIGVFNRYYANPEGKYDPNEFVPIPPIGSEYMEDPSAYTYMTPSYQTGMGMISAYTEYPEACMRVLDYMMGVDGTALFGCMPSDTYDLKAAGVSQEVIDIIDEAIAVYGDKSNAYSNTTGCNSCWWVYPIEQYNYNKFADSLAESNYEVRSTYKGKVFYNPTHTTSFTGEEQEIVSAYKNDIDTYVKEIVARWIAGEEELNDETWNAYLEQLQKMNVDKLTEAYVSAHNRFFGVE